MKNLGKIIILIVLSIFSFSENVFKIESKGIINGIIKEEYGGNGKEFIKNVPSKSIPLEWKNIPKKTKSFVIIMEDYDAIPVMGFSWIHWSVGDIPADKKALLENESRINAELIQGANSWGSSLGGLAREDASYYGGPWPPDKDHTYKITIYALDIELGLKNGYYLNEVYHKMEGHVLGTASINGIYKK